MSYTDTVLDQAQQAITEGRIDDAQKLIAPIIEAEPHNPRAWAVLADATEDAAEAAQYRAKVVELAKSSVAQATAQLNQSGPMPPYQPQQPQPYQSGPMPQYSQQPPPSYYPQPFYPAAQPQARKRGPLAVFMLIGLILVVCSVLWSVLDLGSKPSRGAFVSGPSTSSTVKVTYKITGESGRYVDLTYTNETGATEQKSSVKIPWSKTFNVRRGEFLYISAQLNGTAKVICTITADGATIQTAESSGEYVIASCSGLAR